MYKMNKHLKQTLLEAFGITCASAMIALIVNTVHPEGVRISLHRPPVQYASDSLPAHELPSAFIDGRSEETNGSVRPVAMNTERVLELLSSGEAICIDARSREEYLMGHIPGAVNHPFESDEVAVYTLPQNKWLICYCSGPSCDNGEKLAYVLFLEGYKRVAFYPGGLEAWKKSGLKTGKKSEEG